MAQPYVGEIRMFAGNFAPAGWMFCDGSLQPISEQETLFNLIGTTYGGDGQSTFALPNLQSRVALHTGNGFTIAQTGGAETVTLTTQQIPVHTHPLIASTDAGTQPSPGGGVTAALSPVSIYKPNVTPPTAAMNAAAIGLDGGSQPHDNMQPYLVVNFIISLFGIFPSPT